MRCRRAGAKPPSPFLLHPRFWWYPARVPSRVFGPGRRPVVASPLVVSQGEGGRPISEGTGLGAPWRKLRALQGGFLEGGRLPPVYPSTGHHERLHLQDPIFNHPQTVNGPGSEFPSSRLVQTHDSPCMGEGRILP